MWTSPQFPADLITFTEKILNGKLIFCAVELPTIIRYDGSISIKHEVRRTFV